MRTTLTLDEDVAAQIREKVQETGLSFKQVVNDSLRNGLHTKEPNGARKRFKIEPLPGRPRPGLQFDCIPALLSELEGPMHK